MPTYFWVHILNYEGIPCYVFIPFILYIQWYGIVHVESFHLTVSFTKNNLKGNFLRYYKNRPLCFSIILSKSFMFQLFIQLFRNPCRNRSSRPEVLYEKDVLQNFAKFTEKQCVGSLLLKLQN